MIMGVLALSVKSNGEFKVCLECLINELIETIDELKSLKDSASNH